MALDCGFLLVVGTSLIPKARRMLAKAYPVNSPPLSCTTLTGLGYQAKHVFSNFLAMALLDLVSMDLLIHKFEFDLSYKVPD